MGEIVCLFLQELVFFLPMSEAKLSFQRWFIFNATMHSRALARNRF